MFKLPGLASALRWLFPTRLLAAARTFLVSIFSGTAGTELMGPPGSTDAKLGLEVVLHGLSTAELNGCRGTIAAKLANHKGRWEVKVIQKSGEEKTIALKPSNLMWVGRHVQLNDAASALEFNGCYGLVASQGPDEDDRWAIDARKTLSLKPANLEASPAAENGASGAGASELKQGSKVLVQGLQSSACFNGLSGTVKSQRLSEQGRWEVEISKQLSLSLQSIKMVWASDLFGEMLLTKSGLRPTNDVLSDKRAVLIYFSAHWCPPCKQFTPVLAETYKRYSAKDVEVVFVSSDRDVGSFDGYYGEMPWTTLPFADRGRQATLSSKFGVNGIPMLTVLRGDGTLAPGMNARSDVHSTQDLAKCLQTWCC